MKARILCVCAVVVVGLFTVLGVAKADEFSVDWPIEAPIFIRTVGGGHTGVDMVSGNGESVSVVSASNGTVTSIYYDSYCAPNLPPSSCPTSLSGGWVVVIDHGSGWETRYTHLNEGSILVDSDPSSQTPTNVSSGEQIAIIGNSGHYDDGDEDTSLPIHLHFVQHNGTVVDPYEHLVGTVGGCGVVGTIPTPIPTTASTPVPTPIPTQTPVPTATAEPTPTATLDPTANDHDPPTGSIVDAPVAANRVLLIKATSSDASGVRQVQLKIWPTDGAQLYVDLTHTSADRWETTITVDQYASGTVLNYLIQAWDASVNNNFTQLTGTHIVTVIKDTSKPTGHYINAPTTADLSLTVSAEIVDPSGISGATLYASIGTYEMSREGVSNIWSVTVDTSGFASGTALNYLIHARDVWANGGQVIDGSGAGTITHDTHEPTGYYISSPSIAGSSLTVVAHLEDPSGVSWANLHFDRGEVFAMSREGSTDTWSVTAGTSHIPYGTKFSYVVWASDTRGNSKQIIGGQPVEIKDLVPPKGYLVNVNPNPYNNMILQADFEPDLSGVAWVHAIYKVGNGGWQTRNMSNLHSNHWEVNIDIRYVPHGTRIDYYIFAGDFAGNSEQTTGIQPVDVACPGVALTTWCAEYYNNTSLSGTPAYSKGEGGTYIERNYGAYEPEGGRGGLGKDNFSIRWSKVVDFGTNFFNFSTTSDDGVRVLVDGNVVIGEWHPGGNLNYTVTRFVPAGKYVVVLEYVEYGGLAHVKFTW